MSSDSKSSIQLNDSSVPQAGFQSTPPPISHQSHISFFNIYGRSPYPAWTFGVISALSLPSAIHKTPGIPPPIQAFAFAAIFAGAGYAITQDPDNGAGIASAWSITWCFFNFRPAIKSRLPVPVAMALVGASNAIVYTRRSAEARGWF